MIARIYHIDGSPAPDGAVFVFGSNLSGIHGAGAAKAARVHYGAQMGVGEGPTGRSYAIPTVQEQIAGPLDLSEIWFAVTRFIAYAAARTGVAFHVTRIGCGLAGHSDADIAPMFINAPPNCSFASQWRTYLETTT